MNSTVIDSEELRRLRESHAALVEELRDILEWAIIECVPLREQEIRSVRAVLAQAHKVTG